MSTLSYGALTAVHSAAGQTNVGATRRGYMPGFYIRLDSGVTLAELADRNNYNYAAIDKVAQNGANMTSREQGLLLLNYTDEERAFAVCHPQDAPTNPGAREYQEERQIANLVLPKGTSYFLPLPPLDHIATVSMFEFDRNGQRRSITSRGWRLDELQNVELEINRGVEPGTVTYTCHSQRITQYLIIRNNTRYNVEFKCIKPANQIVDEAILKAEIQSQEPDVGGTVVIDMHIGPLDYGEVLAMPDMFDIFLMQTRLQTDALSQSLFGRINNTPTRKEYVVIDRQQAAAGDCVFALLPEPPALNAFLHVVPRNKVKYVDESMVINTA